MGKQIREKLINCTAIRINENVIDEFMNSMNNSRG